MNQQDTVKRALQIIGDAMQAARKTSKLNQGDLQEEVGLSIPTVRAFEVGKGGKLPNMILLLERYGVLQDVLDAFEGVTADADEVLADAPKRTTSKLPKAALEGEELTAKEFERAVKVDPKREYCVKDRTAKHLARTGFGTRRDEESGLCYAIHKDYARNSSHRYSYINPETQISEVVGGYTQLVVELAGSLLNKQMQTIVEIHEDMIINELHKELESYSINVVAIAVSATQLSHRVESEEGKEIKSAVVLGAVDAVVARMSEPNYI